MHTQSISKIEAEAIAATLKYSTVADACPYPFDSTHGRIFKRAFHLERARQEEVIQQTAAADIKANIENVTPA